MRVILKWVVITLIVIAGIVCVSLILARNYIHEYMHSPVGLCSENLVFEVSKGESFRTLSDRLNTASLIGDPRIFRYYSVRNGYDKRIRAGEFLLTPNMTPLDILKKLCSSDVVQYSLTIPEGLDLTQIAETWEAAGYGTAAEFLKVLDRSEIAGMDRPETGWEGYLFPDTYRFPRNTTAVEAITLMIQQFKAVLKPDWIKAGEAGGLNLHQIVTLASLIEKETGLPEERALIGSVFHNRLNKGMLLQCDPTVIYALGDGYEGRLLTRHLKADHPFNTYTRSGLPPGPIASPGSEALLAACFPAQSNYFYFVADTRGGHTFSETLREHNRAVQQYRRYMATKK